MKSPTGDFKNKNSYRKILPQPAAENPKAQNIRNHRVLHGLRSLRSRTFLKVLSFVSFVDISY